MAVMLIAGGSTSIGRAALRAFRTNGEDVLLADIDRSAPEAAVAENVRGRARAFACDLSDAAAPRRAVEAFGAIDTLFANDGILAAAPLTDSTSDKWDRTVVPNLRGPFVLTQAAAPHLARSSNATVTFTASAGALRGHAGVPAYLASKAGLLGLCRSLADELAPQRTRVNCLLPGWIDTPFNAPFCPFQPDQAAEQNLLRQIPIGRQGAPEQVASAVLFLPTPAARYMTGTFIVVNGGYSAV